MFAFKVESTVSSAMLLKLYQKKVESKLIAGEMHEFSALMLDIPSNAIKAYCNLGGLEKTSYVLNCIYHTTSSTPGSGTLPFMFLFSNLSSSGEYEVNKKEIEAIRRRLGKILIHISPLRVTEANSEKILQFILFFAGGLLYLSTEAVPQLESKL